MGVLLTEVPHFSRNLKVETCPSTLLGKIEMKTEIQSVIQRSNGLQLAQQGKIARGVVGIMSAGLPGGELVNKQRMRANSKNEEPSSRITSGNETQSFA